MNIKRFVRVIYYFRKLNPQFFFDTQNKIIAYVEHLRNNINKVEIKLLQTKHL